MVIVNRAEPGQSTDKGVWHGEAQRATFERLQKRKRFNSRETREIARRLNSAEPGLEIVNRDAAVPPGRDEQPVREFGSWTGTWSGCGMAEVMQSKSNSSDIVYSFVSNLEARRRSAVKPVEKCLSRGAISSAAKLAVSISATLLFCTLALAPSLHAQGTRADYDRAERFLPWNTEHLVSIANVRPHWFNGDQFWYLKRSPQGKEFLRDTPATGAESPAFDQARLAAALGEAAGQTYSATALPFDTFNFTDDGTAIEFSVGAAHWRCSLEAYRCARSSAPPRDAWAVRSPNGKWEALVKDHNLYIRRVETGQVVQLTDDGRNEWDYATPIPYLQLLVQQGKEDVRQRPDVYWSPDSSKLATYRMDSRRAARLTSIQYAPPDQLRPKVFVTAYPLPGEALAQTMPVVFDVPSGRRVDVKTEPLFVDFQGGPYFDWLPDSNHFTYLHYSRGYHSVALREVDASTGDQRAVITEKSDTYIDPGETFVRPANGGSAFLWSSERTGWNQLYLYDANSGRLENAVTQGDWVVRRIVSVDQKNRVVYFLAAGKQPGEDPYQAHLYRVNLDGGNLRLLDPEDADHNVSVSPDHDYFVDNYSRPDLPGEAVLRKTADGSIVRVRERTDPQRLLKTGWKYPVPFKGKAADGVTEIYGLIWRPSNFDASKRYPVVESIYTGPQGFFVPKTFSACCRQQQAVSELGFVVVMIDGRGTAGRSKEFHDASYRNLGRKGIPDHIALMRQMAARYPWMDLSRVGIYGTSAGGYDAAHAMLIHPDFYKVGVSISGNHDHRLDKAWWNELYEGYPLGKSYVEDSNVTLAGNLKGHLLLVQGDVDPNVPPSETMRLVSALMKANKDFDMLFVPNMFHGEGANLYLMRRRWDYFVRYLLAVQPPSGFEIKGPPPNWHFGAF